MSSSIEEEFQPPEWATKEEVIKAAQHYINYWKIEARSRNQQWLDALSENARLRASSFVTAVPVEHYERVVKAGDAVVADLEHLTKSGWFDRCKSVKRWNAAKEGKLRKSADISPPQSPQE